MNPCCRANVPRPLSQLHLNYTLRRRRPGPNIHNLQPTVLGQAIEIVKAPLLGPEETRHDQVEGCGVHVGILRRDDAVENEYLAVSGLERGPQHREDGLCGFLAFVGPVVEDAEVAG